LTTKFVQKDQLDVVKDFTIKVKRNICCITDNIFTINELKDLIKETIINQVESLVQPSYSYANSYIQRIDL
jgi:hypothetical protein